MDKTTLERALHYCEASLEDMRWHWFGTKTDLMSFNMDTNGTKSFDTEEELESYLSDMQNFVSEFRRKIDAEG